jgi:hypothetical protein
MWSKYGLGRTIWAKAVSAPYCAAPLWKKNVKLKLIHKDLHSDEDKPADVTEWMCSDVFDFCQFQSFYMYMAFLLLQRICFDFRNNNYIVLLFKNKPPK